MKRRRGRSQGTGESMDSLLDTMANVVGILVVLVAVMQLAVGDAVDRIVEEGVRQPASLPEVESAEREQEVVASAIVAARGKLEALPPSPLRRGMLLEDVQPLLENLRALPGSEQNSGQELDALQGEVQRKAESVARLQEEVESQKTELDRLDAQLTNSPPGESPQSGAFAGSEATASGRGGSRFLLSLRPGDGCRSPRDADPAPPGGRKSSRRVSSPG